MKRAIGGIGMVLVVLAVVVPARAADNDPYAFQDGMHRIFHAFGHTRISNGMNRPDVADILLADAEAAIDVLPQHLPDRNADGTPFDGDGFKKRLAVFRESIGRLRAAVREGRREVLKTLPGDIFKQCVRCHKAVRLKHLFRMPPGAGTPFQDYMHRVSNHFSALLELSRSGGSVAKTGDHLALIDYYLELLKTVLPTAGPSGVVLEPGRTLGRIGALQRIASQLRTVPDRQRASQIERFRNTVNDFCVTCHGPERLQ